jgi:hypothetical protein
LGEIVELSGLIAAPHELVASEHAARRRRRVEFTICSATFTFAGDRLTVRWHETWGGPKSREVGRAQVERVDVEADDRSAAGRQTWKMVVYLRDGQTFVPVRRSERQDCEKELPKLLRKLGLTSAPPVLPTSAEDLPGAQYVAMAESGAGMQPIVDGGMTLVWTREDGGVVIRMPGRPWRPGGGRPWLLIGADRSTFWARAVGTPPEWSADREVGHAWPTSLIFRVRDIPGDAKEERAWGRGGVPKWSGVWVEMRDGTRVRIAQMLPEAEAAAVVAALSRAIASPSRWGRARAYLDERRAETLGRLKGVSGEGPASPPAGMDSPADSAGPIVLPYAREPADAIRVIRGDGVLRVTVPPVSFWRGWIRQALVLLPFAVLLSGCVIWCATPPRRSPPPHMNAAVVASLVGLAWLALAAILSWGARSELVIADDTLVLEQWYSFGRRRREWRVEKVLAIGESYWWVNALVQDHGRGRAWVGLVPWEGKAERKRLAQILRAALGMDVDRGEEVPPVA